MLENLKKVYEKHCGLIEGLPSDERSEVRAKRRDDCARLLRRAALESGRNKKRLRALPHWSGALIEDGDLDLRLLAGIMLADRIRRVIKAAVDTIQNNKSSVP